MVHHPGLHIFILILYVISVSCRQAKYVQVRIFCPAIVFTQVLYFVGITWTDKLVGTSAKYVYHLHSSWVTPGSVISSWFEMVIEKVVPFVCINDPSSNEACHITTVSSTTQSRALSSKRTSTRALSLIRKCATVTYSGGSISGGFRSTQVCVCMK